MRRKPLTMEVDIAARRLDHPASRTVDGITILDGVRHLLAKEVTMSRSITNYDGGIVTIPVSGRPSRYGRDAAGDHAGAGQVSGPVRATGSYHSRLPALRRPHHLTWTGSTKFSGSTPRR